MGQNTEITRRLHKKNPHCFWCDILTVINYNDIKPEPDNTATTDHLISQNIGRQSKRDSRNTVLSCRKCNLARDIIEVALLNGRKLWPEYAKMKEQFDKRYYKAFPVVSDIKE